MAGLITSIMALVVVEHLANGFFSNGGVNEGRDDEERSG